MRVFRSPPRALVVAFLAAIGCGWVLLSLPIATESGRGTHPVTALFTATSAVCVTGMTVVHTAGYWSMFGELVILVLIQVGGIGIMTAASLLGLLLARRMPLRLQVSTQEERTGTDLGDLRRLLIGIARTSVIFETVVTAFLTVRLWVSYSEPFSRAVYLGFFHSVSAFNSAGFDLFPNGLAPFATDPWICLPLAVAVFAGGLGFPVLFELRRRLRRRRRPGRPGRWSVHTKITLWTMLVMLAAATVAVTAGEWSNSVTLGRFGIPGKILAGFFQAAMRTSGLSSVDIGGMHSSTWLLLDIFMFIGGGSASTAGGIKVTTFALLAFVIWAESRGEPDVPVLGRRLPADIQRQALAVALLSVGAVATMTVALLSLTPFSLDRVLFESVSAFSTVGWSTGVAPELAVPGKIILIVAMFAGRLGPVILVSALALRERARRYDLPEERPIVG